MTLFVNAYMLHVICIMVFHDVHNQKNVLLKTYFLTRTAYFFVGLLRKGVSH
jgi:hypothetical protein